MITVEQHGGVTSATYPGRHPKRRAPPASGDSVPTGCAEAAECAHGCKVVVVAWRAAKAGKRCAQQILFPRYNWTIKAGWHMKSRRSLSAELEAVQYAGFQSKLDITVCG